MSGIAINETRILIQRGDGQCVVVGEFPLNNPLDIARHLVELFEAKKKIGVYDARDRMSWSPKELELTVKQ